VLTTAAAVAVVETVLLGVVLPGLVTRNDTQVVVDDTAVELAGRAGLLDLQLGRLPTAAELPLGDPSVPVRPGRATTYAGGRLVRIPYVPARTGSGKAVPVALLIDASGRIAISSYPARYPVGASVAQVLAAGPVALWDRAAGKAIVKAANGRAGTTEGDVLWSAIPVRGVLGRPAPRTDGDRVSVPAAQVPAAMIYVHVPASADLPLPNDQSLWPEVLQQILVGLAVLVAAVPVGIAFGLLAPRRLIGRLRRLAASTVAVADGDYQHRVPVSGHDEVTQLEDTFNRMAERLAATVSDQRRLAGADERARIARELHDSISQALFSMRMLAGGMRRALPADSPLHAPARTLEETATETINEMQALLLELRPVALGEAGLAAALGELARAYRERLGVAVHTDLTPVGLSDAAEHALLRVAQEAMANAVKHGRAGRIELRLGGREGRATMTVRDDGLGFEPGERRGSGLGLGLMRERAGELGGDLRVESRPGEGTTVEIEVPAEDGTP
jgi:signal transduction histidine kinase